MPAMYQAMCLGFYTCIFHFTSPHLTSERNAMKFHFANDENRAQSKKRDFSRLYCKRLERD